MTKLSAGEGVKKRYQRRPVILTGSGVRLPCRFRGSSFDVSIERPARINQGDTIMRLIPLHKNALLWTVQGLLAALFLFAGGMKLVLPIEALTAQMPLPG